MDATRTRKARICSTELRAERRTSPRDTEKVSKRALLVPVPGVSHAPPSNLASRALTPPPP